MKKLLVITIAAASLAAMQARATIVINVNNSGSLTDHSGNAIVADANSTALLLVDEGSLGAPTLILAAGASDAIGATIGGNWLVIGKSDFTSPGADGLVSLVANATLGGQIVTGRQLDLMWIKGTPGAQNTLNGGFYGSVFGGNPGQDGSDPWLVPADGATININMDTASLGGSFPDSAGGSPNAILVPEPSSVALVVMGLLGGIGLIRRRK